jgi:acetate kinase
MKILVINSGSSSIKYQLFQMKEEHVLAKGMIERIGEKDGLISHYNSILDTESHLSGPIEDHTRGIEKMVSLLEDEKVGVIKKVSEIMAIGHRVVHGGEFFHEPSIIDEKVLRAIEEHIPLAPLHNPVNLMGIRAALGHFKEIPQVAVFDTAFHQTLPAYAFHYALPYEFYQKFKIRRYGFHGTSHQFVSHAYARFAQRDIKGMRMITVHLGNGCSMAAIKDGKSVDTSMGMTPLEGLIMGTRSGDLDPAIPFFLKEHTDLEFMDIEKVLNKDSGLKGICRSNDMRDILDKLDKGDKQAELAVEMYTYRIKKYIGAYAAVLGRLDAIIFTAGIGENSAYIRKLSLAGLENFGINLDDDKNNGMALGSGKKITEIQTAQSKAKIAVVPTNEELEIAHQVLWLISGKKPGPFYHE